MVTEDERIAALELRVAALEDLLEKVAVRYEQEVENAVRGRARLSAILDDAQFAGSGAGVPYDEIGKLNARLQQALGSTSAVQGCAKVSLLHHDLFHVDEMPPGAALIYDKEPE